jgi:cytochrome P450
LDEKLGHKNKGQTTYPPGPREMVPYRLALKFISNPIPALIEISKKYGDISHFKFGPSLHVYLVNNPYHIENILVRHNGNFVKSPGLRLAKRVLGNGLITNEGSSHITQRRLVQPAFSKNRTKIYEKIILEHCLEYLKSTWKDSMVLDIHKEMTKITLSIISKILFGANTLTITEIDKICDSITIIIEYINKLRLPFLRFIEMLPLPLTMRYRQALAGLDKFIYGKIEERKKTIGGKSGDGNDFSFLGADEDADAVGTNETHNKSYCDMLSLLIKSSNSETMGGNENIAKECGKVVGMSDSQLRDEVMTIFLAGHETTANALTWTFYLLSQNPRAESKTMGEIDSVLGNDDDKIITFKDFSKLKYTEMVLMESMRLYPPSWAIGRQALEDYILDAQYVIPSGSVIIMSQYLMHRDSRYFPEPEQFYPDRWTPEFRASIPRFSYFPFGGGPRSCIGEPLAWVEGVIILATVLKKWRITLAENSENIKPLPIVTLRPKNGIRMQLHKRG